MEPLLKLLVTPVRFLKWQVRTSAAKTSFFFFVTHLIWSCVNWCFKRLKCYFNLALGSSNWQRSAYAMEEILPVTKAAAVGPPLSERGCYLNAARRVLFAELSNLVSDNETGMRWSLISLSVELSLVLTRPLSYLLFLHRAVIVWLLCSNTRWLTSTFYSYTGVSVYVGKVQIMCVVLMHTKFRLMFVVTEDIWTWAQVQLLKLMMAEFI